MAAFFGPIHLEINQCFVSDLLVAHDDAFISIRIPTPWGKLHLGYVICLGADEIRRPGFYSHWQKRLPKVVYGQACPPADDEYFPF